jgi:hypothetical protein
MGYFNTVYFKKNLGEDDAMFGLFRAHEYNFIDDGESKQ